MKKHMKILGILLALSLTALFGVTITASATDKYVGFGAKQVYLTPAGDPAYIGHEAYLRIDLQTNIEVDPSASSGYTHSSIERSGYVRFNKVASNNPTYNFNYDTITIQDQLVLDGITFSASVGTGGGGVGVEMSGNTLTYTHTIQNAKSLSVNYEKGYHQFIATGYVAGGYNNIFVNYTTSTVIGGKVMSGNMSCGAELVLRSN